MSARLDARPRAALDSIDGSGGRLLAARAYLRSEARLAERWSWTAAQVAAYPGSFEQRAHDAAVAQVRCVFERANPGFTLYVKPTVRSLEIQLRNWNANNSVRRAGDHLLATTNALVTKRGFPGPQTTAGRNAFRAFLVAHVPQPTPALAAPGLSAHGRMRAIDFQVQQGDRIVARADVSTARRAWYQKGWSKRLARAVKAADVGLVGPLRSPDEPWHYEFESAAARRTLNAPCVVVLHPRPPTGR